MFEGKTLLITGGTGSFGNAVLKRFLNTDIKEIRVFSRDEQKQYEMKMYYKNEKIKFYIGDVRDIDTVEEGIKIEVRQYLEKCGKNNESCSNF